MLKDYKFETNSEFREHLKERHFGESAVGSVFYKEAFSSPEELIEFALGKIGDYSGELLVREVKMPYPIGLDAVVSLDELPEGVEVKKEIRDEVSVNVVYNVKRKPTNQIVIIAGPLDDLGKPGKHGFRTIFPGEYCPDFTDEKFWKKHAFAMEK